MERKIVWHLIPCLNEVLSSSWDNIQLETDNPGLLEGREVIEYWRQAHSNQLSKKGGWKRTDSINLRVVRFSTYAILGKKPFVGTLKRKYSCKSAWVQLGWVRLDGPLPSLAARTSRKSGVERAIDKISDLQHYTKVPWDQTGKSKIQESDVQSIVNQHYCCMGQCAKTKTNFEP